MTVRTSAYVLAWRGPAGSTPGYPAPPRGTPRRPDGPLDANVHHHVRLPAAAANPGHHLRPVPGRVDLPGYLERLPVLSVHRLRPGRGLRAHGAASTRSWSATTASGPGKTTSKDLS